MIYSPRFADTVAHNSSTLTALPNFKAPLLNMSSDSAPSKYKYGDKPGWRHVVEAVEALGGSASRKQVDDYLKELFPHYRDNTAVNLYACSVNSNARTNWPFNKRPRRSDDEENPHHEYDRLFKHGVGKKATFELYQSALHGVWEIYCNDKKKWATRCVAEAVEQDEAHQLQIKFDAAVKAAAGLTSEERRLRLAESEKYPRTNVVTTKVFVRSEYVVAEVLHRAQGKCEKCRRDAPFPRASDGTPYLEVHHITPLARGGEDTIENAVAVCPNCHRQAHFG
ncbi:HNH endonuclease [Paraburkholderia caribensis]|uniref:HNH endonuclease n=1 Tax=Paraburkholderia caribensis TaxID=75105 RepID=UPI001CB3BAA3|nr:HNH endonuclease signature motif containing protein [Paraburkholderia caribensis]CAG9239467.1 HNH endonuclease [Paraburkholderia caribensis]